MPQHVAMAPNGRLVVPAKSMRPRDAGRRKLHRPRGGRTHPPRSPSSRRSPAHRPSSAVTCRRTSASSTRGQKTGDARPRVSDPVLDASAVLALLNREPGHEKVAAILPAALIGTVNLTEVISKLCERGVPADAAMEAVQCLGVDIVPHSPGLRAPCRRTAAVDQGVRAVVRSTGPASLSAGNGMPQSSPRSDTGTSAWKRPPTSMSCGSVTPRDRYRVANCQFLPSNLRWCQRRRRQS